MHVGGDRRWGTCLKESSGDARATRGGSTYNENEVMLCKSLGHCSGRCGLSSFVSGGEDVHPKRTEYQL